MDIDQLAPIAARHDLDPALILAFIQVESSNNLFAVRAEPVYRYVWNVKTNKPFRKLGASEVRACTPPADFPSIHGSRCTEWWGQRSSWGPMQVMGAVARELGFRGFFPELCGEPGIEIGCKLLVRLRARFKDDLGFMISAYNCGTPHYLEGRFSNQDYVDHVLREFQSHG
jgi:hypothetical protein